MTAELEVWLHDGQSLMKRLIQHHLRPRIQVLRQGWYFPQVGEAACLMTKARRYVFIREVEIRHEQQALLFARTAIPLATLSGPERCLAHLGDRSLGSVLFSYPDLVRSPFEVRPRRMMQYSSAELWERQSVFYVRAKPLVLTEVFLPSLLDIIKSL